jgi:hypothetical protein
VEGEGFEPGEGGDLCLQLLDGAGGSGLVEDFLFGSLDLVLGSVLEVLDVLGVEGRGCGGKGGDGGSSLKKLELAETLFEPLAAPSERLGDRLGG